jgi:hypothetical protein
MTGTVTHGHTRGPAGTARTSRTYNTWLGMRQRCHDPNAENYPRYGGLGITVCDRWFNSFDAFLADMGERPDGRTLDRVDRTGSYEPGNCRWATAVEQAANRRKPALRPTDRRGHRFEGANLARRGKHRGCRACITAQGRATRARARGESFDFGAVADQIYAELMGAS